MSKPNLKKEAAEVRALLEEADRLDTQADLMVAEADDCRWYAAEKAHDLIVVQKLVNQSQFAQMSGLSTGHVSRLVRVWKWWLENMHGSADERPLFYNAEEIVRDATVKERALAQGKAPSTVAKNERDAKTALRNPASAEAIMQDPFVRETARKAIVAAETAELLSRPKSPRPDQPVVDDVTEDVPPASMYKEATEARTLVAFRDLWSAAARFHQRLADQGLEPMDAEEIREYVEHVNYVESVCIAAREAVNELKARR